MKPRGTVEERLWRYISIEGTCWIWTARLNAGGYGTIKVAGKSLLAHRVSYELYVNQIEGELDHLCRNRDCINPAHLEDVDHATNMRRGDRESYGIPNRQKTECPQGHNYEEHGVYIDKQGFRKCRTCVLQRVKDYQERKHA